MNNTKIDWCDMTWNPVTGCLHGCKYCYARKIANRFAGKAYKQNKDIFAKDFKATLEIPDRDKAGHIVPFPHGFLPTFHKYRLNEPAKIREPQKIFVCSMADLFGDWVPDEWIHEVLKASEAAPWHTYMFLTKNPKRFKELQFKIPLPTSYKYWYGTTITSQEDTLKLAYLGGLANRTFVSIEPLLGAADLENVQFGQHTTMNVLEGCGVNTKNCCQSMPNTYCKPIDWVIIGQQTGPGAVPPKHEWVQSIIDQCRASGVPVFVKHPLYEKFPIQEWPEELQGEMERK